MKRRHAYVVTLFASFGFAGTGHADSPRVFELFTSQGCSSCPPADRFAANLADDPDILVLSYHVSYWNYLGWEDPYSSDASTARQRSYASAMRSSRVYTPQAIIQGQFDVVGSDRSRANNLLQQAATLPWVAAAMSRTGSGLRISLPKANINDATLWLVQYTPKTQSVVKRGENSGRTLTHRNSVASITSLGKWHGDARTIEHAASKDSYALLIQKDGYGPILGGGW